MTNSPSISSHLTSYQAQYPDKSGTSSGTSHVSGTQITSSTHPFGETSGAHIEDWNPDKKYKNGDIVRRDAFVSQHYDNGHWKVIGNNNSPPETSSIKETCSREKGCTYKVKQSDGKVWTGENPMGKKDDIKTMSFSDAYIHKDFITSDYTGNNLAGVRMSLAIPNARPTGPYWVDEQQPNGQTLPHCTSTDPKHCTFATR